MNAHPSISAEQHFLSEALEPIRQFLDDPAVVEISCQRSNEIWLERIGQLSMIRQEVDGLDQEAIRHMASRAASFTKQTINAENPLLSATLTNGERVQFVLNPTSATGHAFSIRKQFIRRFDLDDYEKAGAFRFTKVTGDDYIDDVDIELSRLLRAGQARAFLQLAAINHRSMLISGGTSTGKTTFLNTMLTAIPDHERFILMQDTAELEPRQENVVSLLVSKGAQGEARVTMTDLLASALRLRPDRIFMGELRGDEAIDAGAEQQCPHGARRYHPLYPLDHPDRGAVEKKRWRRRPRCQRDLFCRRGGRRWQAYPRTQRLNA
ncbi:ATPase, T2SS/T4P/T4SS family [Agrobacterium salinitolerans]|uniref:ATPase, T2SS/T4P/T4SS family n=1 Tax=Agrobacterium salinitolerans TaxID=1183413 RepID=UPI001FCE5F4D|nr:ATPase, T2SS/T4P/T4SS family [Agrobacterium salinitolerans]